MKRPLIAMTVIMFPAVASAYPTCVPECVGGNAAYCCVMQYSNGTYGPPYCRLDGCNHISAQGLPQVAKILPASQVPPEAKMSKVPPK